MGEMNKVMRAPKTGLTRRSFLTGAALFGVGAAATSLAGCAPSSASGGTAAASSVDLSEMPLAGHSENDWLGNAPDLPTDFTEEATYDVVIVGASHSGTACFRRAVEEGLNVLLIDKQVEENFTVLGNQNGHLNSAWLKAQGVPSYDATEFIENYQLQSSGRAQPELIRQYAQYSGEAFDWMIEPLSDDLLPSLQIWPSPDAWKFQIGAFQSYAGGANFNNNIKGALLANQEQAIEQGGERRWGMTAMRLVGDATSGIEGVVAKDADGNYCKFTAQVGVVIAAGDFSANSTMFKALCNEVAESNPNDADTLSGQGYTGDGIKMGLWAGAAMEIGPRAAMGGNLALPMSPLMGTGCLRLNAYGKRYCNEGFAGCMNSNIQGARQPLGKIYDVWDANWRTMCEAQPAAHLNLDWTPTSLDSLETTMQAIVDAGVQGYENMGSMVYAANSVEELAELLGLDSAAKANMIESINHYNELCAAGKDEDYAKDPALLFPLSEPPYFACGALRKANSLILVTLSGLFVDGNQQCLDKKYFLPIKGLYATGNSSGGRFPLQYTAPINGISIGMANTLGYKLGEYLGTADIEAANKLSASMAQQAEALLKEAATAPTAGPSHASDESAPEEEGTSTENAAPTK